MCFVWAWLLPDRSQTSSAAGLLDEKGHFFTVSEITAVVQALLACLLGKPEYSYRAGNRLVTLLGYFVSYSGRSWTEKVES